jgi:hypothetical protein
LSGSTTKKVVVKRFDRESIAGFVNPQEYLRPEGIEVMGASGNLLQIPFSEVKTVCFVRDFGLADLAAERRLFSTRPKREGLWVRMRFRDDEVMDGVLANDLLSIETYGFSFVPPDASANNQRLFIPRQALASLQVMGVVGSPLRKTRKPQVPESQLNMFE